jgi:rubredoxin
MKTAMMQVNGVYLNCPECEAPVYDPDTGSELHDIGSFDQLPTTIKCDCGASFRKPTWPTQRKLKAARS